MLYMIQIWCPPPPPLLMRLRTEFQQIESKECYIYLLLIKQAKHLNTLQVSSSSVAEPFNGLLGCLCYCLLKMNAQDEQP